MEASAAIELVDRLIQGISTEINNIKSEVVSAIIMQVAVFSHDHIAADRPDFGEVSDSPSLDEEVLAEFEELKAVLLDREQRRNAVKHLKRLLREGNTEAMQLMQQELGRFFKAGETYKFLLEPESEHPNEYIKPYPYN